MTKVTQAHIDARTNVIREAAEKVFADKGFAGATMQDIAREAGLSAGAIYRYFPSKEALIEALSADQAAQMAAVVESIRSKGDTAAVLHSLADTFFRPLEDPDGFLDQCIEFELTSEARRNPQIRAARNRSYASMVQAFTAVIRRGQAEGVINKSIDPDSTARLMIAAFEGLTMQLAAGEPVNVRKYTKVLKAMMSGGFWTGASKEKQS